ncbi:N-formylglutamate deformylase [Terrarubrum flagellatum]|uniref:N-formylglutamate deformylase n=1 Tax=Terrirubrum flagellatum TaxID=2895980 RepID=UPI0031450C41
MSIVTIDEGPSPLILSMPHPGTQIPGSVHAQLNDVGLAVADTDWHMRELYVCAHRFHPTIVEATQSRYVIDLNRDPTGASLYPGQATTELVPTTDFDGRPIWKMPPGEAEIERRKQLYFKPYHDALAAQIARVKAKHGYCVLYDCHSIRSHIPRLFPGELPILNLGTNGGLSCAKSVHDAASDAAANSGLSHVVNGRFKGGWITRYYGRPDDHVHAIQMEIAQRAYLARETAPCAFDAAVARPLRQALDNILDSILRAAAALEGQK